jgi:lipid-A-disaccharide synthase
LKYYLIAGEASGDLHASNLMRSLKAGDSDADFRFYGGDKMAAVGGTLVKHYREMSYMGFIPVLTHARTILRNMRACKQDILEWQPDVVILVDYPGFNLKIAKYVKEHSKIPVYYYISPKIWAWKEYRIKSIRRYVDELFSILPFEVDFFEKKHHYPIHYVGNPCVDAIAQYREQRALPQEKPSKPMIAIVAGSRVQEIKKNLSIMLQAASKAGDYHLIITGAPNISPNVYSQHIPQGIDVEVVYDKTYETIERSDAALVTSGTATLETALLGTPQVVCYYISAGRLMKWLKSKVLKVKYVSLVNLICGREVVRELIASDMTESNVLTSLQHILPGGEGREQQLKDYEELRRVTGPSGASTRAASAMIRLLKHQKEDK